MPLNINRLYRYNFCPLTTQPPAAERQLLNSAVSRLGFGGVAIFFAAVAALVVLAGFGNSLGLKTITRQASRDMMVTSEGPVAAGDPLVVRLQDILYPGYRDILERLNPPLFESSQFTLVNVLLENGRQVAFPYQWWLPIDLAAERAPHVLVFGSSRAREAVRPDVLSRALGGKRVLNFGVSAATPAVMDTLFDALFARLRTPVETIVFFIDDFAFSQEYVDLDLVWKRLSRQQADKHSITARLTEKGREALNLLPTWRRLPGQAAKPAFASCDDPRRRAEIAGDPPSGERKNWRLEAGAIETFSRLVAKAETKAARVVLIAMPTTDYHKRRAAGFDPVPALEAKLKRPIVSGALEAWGLSDDSFLGFAGEACGFDGHHVNTAAAVEFSRALGRRLADGKP